VHQLGYNFANAFELTYEDENGEQATSTNTCYGMGFGRTLAATISHHGDDHVLVLPPKVAPMQVVIVPILFKGKEKIAQDYAEKLRDMIKEAGIRVTLDDDNRLNPGDKYYKWEMYGVPLRIEVGPREAQNKKATLVRRDNFDKTQIDEGELVEKIEELFQAIFENLRDQSKKKLESLTVDAYDMDQLQIYMDSRMIVRINWCGDPDCAFNIKDMVSGEIRGTRWDVEEEPTGNCILCKDEAKYVAYVSRTY